MNLRSLGVFLDIHRKGCAKGVHPQIRHLPTCRQCGSEVSLADLKLKVPTAEGHPTIQTCRFAGLACRLDPQPVRMDRIRRLS